MLVDEFEVVGVLAARAFFSSRVSVQTQTKRKMSSLRVPKALQSKFGSISGLTDEFCERHLNAEYAHLARAAIAALCRKRPSPLERGRMDGWACGVIHALGTVNFLFDADQFPHLTARQVFEGFGVSAATGGGKSRAVRDALGMGPLDPDWTLPSLMQANPAVWMLLVDGIAVDVRTMPREIQEAAYLQGLIPYVPESEEGS
jgi:hypothetical protein